MAAGWQVERASRDDREELLALWDEHILRHRYGAGWEQVERHIYGGRFDDVYEYCLVIRDETGRIASALAALPMTVLVGGEGVGVTVITGVVTVPERRGGGLMTGLLEAALAPRANPDRPLAMLWGYRDRYRRFGFDICGGLRRSFIPARKLPAPDAALASRIRELELERDAALVARLGKPVNLVPDFADGQPDEVYGRALHRTHVLDLGGSRALVTVRRDPVTDPNVLEVLHVAGDPSAIGALLGHLVALGGHGECSIAHAVPAVGEVGRWLFDIGEWFRIEHACNVRISDLVGLMERMRPFLGPLLEEVGVELSLSMIRGGSEQRWCGGYPGGRRAELSVTDVEMTRVLFGPERPSGLPFVDSGGTVLDAVLPVPLYVSPLEVL